MMIAALFLMIAQANDANAQRPGMDPEMRAEFAKMAAQKVAGELKLDKAEREWFEPLYMEYADSLRKAQKIDLPEKNKEIKELRRCGGIGAAATGLRRFCRSGTDGQSAHPQGLQLLRLLGQIRCGLGLNILLDDLIFFCRGHLPAGGLAARLFLV